MVRRGRPKKPGRAEVATEHMIMMGFNQEDISRELDTLLELYGEKGWWFIESDAYKVLIDALLDAQEKGAQPENNGNGNLLEMEPVDTNVIIALPEATDPEPPHSPLKKEENIRRKPCYGWISYEYDVEDEILELSPIREYFPRKSDCSYDEMEPKRKTRWDLAPDEI